MRTPGSPSVYNILQVGVLSLQEGLALARDREVDLILINENASPPVCKLIDYSKWRFQKEKKAKELKKSAKSTEVKEIQMSYKIDVGDLAVRQRACLKFLKGGNRIKVSHHTRIARRELLLRVDTVFVIPLFTPC